MRGADVRFRNSHWLPGGGQIGGASGEGEKSWEAVESRLEVTRATPEVRMEGRAWVQKIERKVES